MKKLIKYLLQKLLGYQQYLYVFASYKIKFLKKDKKERDFFAFIEAINTSGSLLDVGANIGIMTYHMSCAFPDRNILAIEPIPSNISVLLRIIEKYNLANVELIPHAVGDRPKEEIKMVLPRDGKVKMQGLAHVVHDTITEWNEGDIYSVKSDTIDQIVGGEKIAGIKMDIENYEFFGLKGAKKVLMRDHPLVYLELWDNENRKKCFELLTDLGYRAYVNSKEGLIPYEAGKHNKQNFVFKVD
ncbi:MAG: FkbM family methyltransferase [Crocinitomicaceae bacterium]